MTSGRDAQEYEPASPEAGEGGAEIALLKSENARLRHQIIDLEADTEEVLRALRVELDEALRESAERRQAIRALDREVIQLRAMLAEAERQMSNIRQTFIYRIGETIVSARTLKGLRQLPRRLLALRRAYLEKRGLLSPPGETKLGYAERLRFMEEALRVLGGQGADAATNYVRSMPGADPEDKARALVELAHALWREDPAKAASLAVEAGALDPLEPRLRALVLAMFDHGEVDAPALILTTLTETLTATPADRARRETVLAYERQLASPLRYPARALATDAAPCVAVVSMRSLPHDVQGDTFRAQSIVDAARQAGVNAFVVTHPGYQYPASGEGEPVQRLAGSTPVVRLPLPEDAPGVFDRFVPAIGKMLAQVFTARGVTCVHALGDPALSAAACWAARASGASFTLDIAEAPIFGGHREEGWTATERFRAGLSLFAETARVADRRIVRSRAVEQLLRELGLAFEFDLIDDCPSEQIGRSTPTDVAAIRAQLGLENRRIIGVYDSLDLDEGLSDLLEAFARVLEADPTCALLYLGSGHGAEALRHRAAMCGVIDHVRISPQAARRKPVDCLSAMDLAVFPKRRPTAHAVSAPFEVQAALAVGVPAVAVDNAWARDWITHEVTGLLVAPGDAVAMAKAIMRVLNSTDLSDRLARSGQELARVRGRLTAPAIVQTFSGAGAKAAA